MIDLITIIAFLSLSLMYLKHALHIFQQNRYEFERYTKWLLKPQNYHFNDYFIYVALCFIAMFTFDYFDIDLEDISVIVITIIFAIRMMVKEDKINYIKPLVYTNRVKRQIFVIAILIISIISAMVLCDVDIMIIAVLVAPLCWLLVYVMAIITLPFENMGKKRYENMARKILEDMPYLKKVGITGSFGKTSTKNIVENILSEKYYTLMTPASFNTPMGITITIRQYLKKIHELFICEMGADHVGEITYLMNFVKPSYGIVTSIGPQHLSTFHSLENIIKEKMQMIELLPSDGVGIINIDNEYIKNYNIKNDVKIVSIAIKDENADFFAKDINYDINGSHFTLVYEGEEYPFECVLLGEHNVMNVLAGIALAKNMGMSIEEIQKAVKKIRPIEHRLQLKKFNGFTFIDNAFNSNPVGCKLSLDVLAKMPGKHIIITPGLIDLGSKEYEFNKEFGAYMKDKADYVILVGRNTSKAIVDGLKESDYDMGNVTIVDSVKEAFNIVYTKHTIEDTILLENDLPDAFL